MGEGGGWVKLMSVKNDNFQSCVMSYLIGIKSNKDDLRTLANIFNSLDQNKDGYLSPQEIEDGMKSI